MYTLPLLYLYSSSSGGQKNRGKRRMGRKSTAPPNAGKRRPKPKSAENVNISSETVAPELKRKPNHDDVSSSKRLCAVTRKSERLKLKCGTPAQSQDNKQEMVKINLCESDKEEKSISDQSPTNLESNPAGKGMEEKTEHVELERNLCGSDKEDESDADQSPNSEKAGLLNVDEKDRFHADQSPNSESNSNETNMKEKIENKKEKKNLCGSGKEDELDTDQRPNLESSPVEQSMEKKLEHLKEKINLGESEKEDKSHADQSPNSDLMPDEPSLQEKLNFLIKAVEDLKSKETKADLIFEGLYYNSRKKVEALTNKNTELCQKLDVAHAKIEAYRVANDVCSEAFTKLRDTLATIESAQS